MTPAIRTFAAIVGLGGVVQLSLGLAGFFNFVWTLPPAVEGSIHDTYYVVFGESAWLNWAMTLFGLASILLASWLLSRSRVIA